MEIEHDVDLRRFNTFGIAAVARRFVRLESVADVIALVALEEPFVVIGGGSNIVLSGDPHCLVALMAIAGRERLDDAADARRIRLAAGESWDAAVAWSLEVQCPGLENLSAIPGTCGGAPIQNIGAYGVELSQRLESVDAIDVRSGEWVRLSNAECRFGYRDSLFKREAGRFIVTALTLRLPEPWQPVLGYADLKERFTASSPTPLQVRRAVSEIRAAKLPDWTRLGNVGSFFKNPLVTAGHVERLLVDHPGLVHYPQPDGSSKVAAGWLIDQAGWRGRSVGRVAVHDRQALVLVNRGGANGSELLALADRIRAEVSQRFDIQLEREPVVI
ncbi:UDP-N-acetylmuramate dehydrogenase [soil metagenome]